MSEDWKDLERFLHDIPGLGPLHFFPSIDSTNRFAVEQGRKGAPAGTLVVADAQSAGRGRLGRNWESPAGRGLYFSLLLRPELPAASAPLLTLAMGLGLAGRLRELGVPSLCVKWPNDLLVNRCKLGGILTEMFPRGDRVDFVVVGVGLNVSQASQDFSPEVADLATSLRLATHRDWPRTELLAQLLPAMLQENDRLAREGSSFLQARWEKESGMLGLAVAYSDDASRQDSLRPGRVAGLAEDGRLRIQNEDGSTTDLLAGDVRLLEPKART